MKEIPVVIVSAAALMLAAVSPAKAAATPGVPHIVVRLYDADPAASGAWADAIAAAGAILHRANVNVEWRRCGLLRGEGPADACSKPLGTNELALRLVPGRVPENAGPLPLGYSLIDSSTGTGSLATIHPDRVAWLAAASGVDRATLLARAIAHEIGHLLLGTNAHRRLGLMRAIWSQEILHRNLETDWLFTEADAEEIRAGLRNRMDKDNGD